MGHHAKDHDGRPAVPPLDDHLTVQGDTAPGGDTAVAPGGWRRGVVGLVVGLLAGAAIALLEPRESSGRGSRCC